MLGIAKKLEHYYNSLLSYSIQVYCTENLAPRYILIGRRDKEPSFDI